MERVTSAVIWTPTRQTTMSGVPADLGLHSGAGDENRTRTISLGIQQIGAFDRTELGNRCAVSDRQGPCGIRANGPPMAHGLMAGGRWPIGKDRSGGGDRLEALWLLHMLLHASLTSVICADWGPLRYPPRGGLPDRAVRSKHVRLAAGLTLQAYCRRAGCWAAPHQCRGE